MRRWSLGQLLLTLGSSAILWAIVAGFCLLVGSTGNGLPTIEQFLERLPRVLLASLIGAALAGAGVIFQAMLRNPLADPYLLGVSSGASLASYLWRLPAVTALLTALHLGHSALTQQTFSFAGALLSVAVVFVLSIRAGRLEPLSLLLVGVIVNVVNAALFLLVNELNRDQTQQAAFLVGSIQTPSIYEFRTLAVLVGACLLLLLLLSHHLNAALLGEAEALSLGVNIHRLRWIALVLASLMTASAVAVSGPIGFIGLICPHLTRLLSGSDQRRLFPAAVACGAALLSVADAASRMLAQPHLAGTVLPVGILTGLLGGPFFLLLLLRSRRSMLAAEGLL